MFKFAIIKSSPGVCGVVAKLDGLHEFRMSKIIPRLKTNDISMNYVALFIKVLDKMKSNGPCRK